MTLTNLWKMVADAFGASPYLGALFALVLWLSFCWKFRLVTIGRKHSLQDRILATFSLESRHETGTTLDALSNACVLPNSSIECDNPDKNANSATHTWTVREIFQIYWSINARGRVIKYTTLLIVFAAFCLLFMHLAQPRENVSLLNVANILGVWTFVPLAMLALLSLVIVLSTTHQLPCVGIKEQKPHTIILFAW